MKIVYLVSFLCGSATVQAGKRNFLRRNSAITPCSVAQSTVFVDAGAVGEDEAPITGNVWLTQNLLPIGNVPDNYDETLFKSHRSGIAPFSYTIGGFSPGELAAVTLGFAENYVENCSTGKRVFNVTVNGQPFAIDLDVFAAVGCQNALLMTGSYAADSIGQFVIEFVQITHHPMVSTISIKTESTREVPLIAAAAETTDSPISPPSGTPSGAPSPNPSDVPSVAPSDVPSSAPSDVPSSAPSDVPSSVPSDTPSAVPSDAPSAVPSDAPSAVPSDAPSAVPSDAPSSAPSDTPSSGPSSIPTANVLIEESDRSVFDTPAPEVPVVAKKPIVFIDAGAVGEDESTLTGNVWLTQNMLPIGNVPVTYDETVFKSHRSGIAPFSYTISGFASGELSEVTLGFAENYVDNCRNGNRVFNVTVNGEPFATDLDVYAVVGCQNAYILSKPCAADSNGQYVIEFARVKNHPMVSLITIDSLANVASDLPSGTPSDAPSSVPSDAPSSTPSDAPSSVPSDSPSNSPSDSPSTVPSDAPSSAPSVTPSFSALTDGSSRRLLQLGQAKKSRALSTSVFIDAGAIDEDLSTISGNVWVTQNMKNITNVPSAYEESVFRSHRSGTAPFTYTIGGFAPGQTADVTLGFAENFVDNCSKNNRVFTVAVNGESFAENLDVYAVVGCQKALVLTKSYAANSNGQFVIEFTTVKHHPMISLIEISAQDATSDVPSSAPSDMPSSIPSDVPSDAPSDVPSDAPSDVPSDAPSDVPSDAPSDAPSDVPSSSPSVALVAASESVFINAGALDEDESFLTGKVWISSNMLPIKGVPSSYEESTFQSHRSGTAPFSYTIGGFQAGESCDITLGFAENFVDNCNKGDRIFSVIINGDPFVIDLDVYAVAGCQTAFVMTKSYVADSTGLFVIVFTKVQHHPMVSLIEIDSLETRAPTTSSPVTVAPVVPLTAAPVVPAIITVPVTPPTSAPIVVTQAPILVVAINRAPPTLAPQAVVVAAADPTTNSPQVRPSASPSWSPSASPTASPSSKPSLSPSSTPSYSPSVTPTAIPSAKPTGTPSSRPSNSPSVSPSNAPSSTPSALPTASPVWSPSSVPTKIISAAPSSLPNVSPSTAPAQTPSSLPSPQPSTSPTATPVVPETMSPVAQVLVILPLPQTAAPIAAATSVPTTSLPTSSPVAFASNGPSAGPTAILSAVPSSSVTVESAGEGDPNNGYYSVKSEAPSSGVTVDSAGDRDIVPTVNSEAPSSSPVAAGAIISLTLVDSYTGEDVATLKEGEIISLSEIGTSTLTIRANTNTSVSHVRFSCGGTVHSEDTLPYVMSGKAGYSDEDAYVAVPLLSQNGLVAVLVEAYDSTNRLIDVIAVTFTVVA